MSKNIKSYVVFDTESTGLPSPGNNPRITELCLIALTREEIKSKQRNHRVFNKLHLCINPCRKIHHKTSELTGLYNDSLSLQATLSKQADLIVSFLRNLPQPTCLLAHNGHRFDFPLLKAELKRSHKSLSENVHCADTYEAFRTFDGLSPVPDFLAQLESQRKRQQISKDNEEINQNSSSVMCESKVSNDSNTRSSDMNERDRKRCSDCQMTSDENAVKEIKLECENNQQQITNEVTPSRKTAAHSLFHQHHHDDHSGKSCQSFGNNSEDISNVRKRLFTSPKLTLKSKDNQDEPSSGISKSDISPDTSFSSSQDCSFRSNDDSDVDKVGDESNNSTQSYFIPDSSKGSSNSKLSQNHHIQSQHSISDSDKDFLEACKEVDLLLPLISNNGNTGSRSTSNVTITTSEVKEVGNKNASRHQSEIAEIPKNEKEKIQQGCVREKNVEEEIVSSKSCSRDTEMSSDCKRTALPVDRLSHYNSRGEMNKLSEENSSKVATMQSQFPNGRKSYALGKLYTFYFGQKPDVVHTAEDDCKILLKLILLNVDKFISYCDQKAVLFSDIDPMY